MSSKVKIYRDGTIAANGIILRSPDAQSIVELEVSADGVLTQNDIPIGGAGTDPPAPANPGDAVSATFTPPVTIDGYNRIANITPSTVTAGLAIIDGIDGNYQDSYVWQLLNIDPAEAHHWFTRWRTPNIAVEEIKFHSYVKLQAKTWTSSDGQDNFTGMELHFNDQVTAAFGCRYRVLQGASTGKAEIRIFQTGDLGAGVRDDVVLKTFDLPFNIVADTTELWFGMHGHFDNDEELNTVAFSLNGTELFKTDPTAPETKHWKDFWNWGAPAASSEHVRTSDTDIPPDAESGETNGDPRGVIKGIIEFLPMGI